VLVDVGGREWEEVLVGGVLSMLCAVVVVEAEAQL